MGKLLKRDYATSGQCRIHRPNVTICCRTLGSYIQIWKTRHCGAVVFTNLRKLKFCLSRWQVSQL